MSITLNTKLYDFAGWIQTGIARYLNKDADTPNGFLSATARVDEPSKGGSYKIRWKLKLPTVVNPTEASCLCPDGILRENFADVVVTVDPKATAAERNALAVSLKDLVASDAFATSITSLSTPSA